MKKTFLQYSNYSISRAKKQKNLNERKSENIGNSDVLNKIKQNSKTNQFIEKEIRMLNKKIKNIRIELDNLRKSRIFREESNKQKNQKIDW